MKYLLVTAVLPSFTLPAKAQDVPLALVSGVDCETWLEGRKEGGQ